MRATLKDLRSFAPGLPDTVEQITPLLLELGFEATAIDAGTLEVGMTPNRGDAMSALGLARDLMAWIDRDRKQASAVLRFAGTKQLDRLPVVSTPTVSIEVPALVSVYEGVVFADVTVGPSPAWLAKAVTRLGWRSINTVVDLTNYLVDRYGQPLHAFDLDAILGQMLTVRASKAGETLRTLDDVDRELPAGALVIQDRDALVDLVGIMGGANSQINPGTKRVLIQAATVDRDVIRRTTNALQLRTQAAIRYERGTDPNIARPVLNEAIRLVRRAKIGRAIGRLPSLPMPPGPAPIGLRPAVVDRLLGFTVAPARQQQLLERLGCQVTRRRTTLAVTPPSWRHDLVIWQDLTEEIARLSGLNQQLPATELAATDHTPEQSEIEWAEALKDRLIELGLSEVQTYSFVSKSLLDAFDLPHVGELANPLNPTLRFLRPSLVPNLAQVAAANQLFEPILIFEIGHVFTLQHEETRLAIGLVGRTESTPAWLARLSDQLGIDSAALTAHALVTEATDAQRAALKIRKPRATFIEIRLADLLSARRIPATFRLPAAAIDYRPVSRFPAVSRDLAIIVDRTVPAGPIEPFIRSFDQWIEAVEQFDEYQSDRLGHDKVSRAFHIRYADPDRTLTESEVSALHDRLARAVERTFGATLR